MSSENKIHQVALEFKEFGNDRKDMERYGLFRDEMGADFPVLIIPNRRIGKHDGDNDEFYIVLGEKCANILKKKAMKTGLVKNAYVEMFR